MLRKNSKPDRVWVDQGTELGGEFNKFCKGKVIKNYSTRSETKAAVAETAIRSLKNIIYRFEEENSDKYVHKMDSFVNTMNTRVNRSIGKSPKNVKNSDFLSIFLPKTLLLSTKNHALKLETKFESPSTISHLEKVTSLNLQMKFFKLLKLRL